jgi:Amt family ammonium transporter
VALAAAAGGFCFGTVLLYERFGLARLPNAFGTHAVAGLAGALLTGVFAQKALNDQGANGALFGRAQQAEIQLIACVAIATYAAAMTYVLLKVIDATIGLRNEAEPGRPPAEANERCEITGVRERRPGAARIASL